MSDAEVMAALSEAIVAVAPERRAVLETLCMDTRIDALGLDSLSLVHVICAVEDKLEMSFDDYHLARMQTVADLATVVRTGRLP